MTDSIFNEDNTEIIIAGPGVGKTTELLNRIEKALLEGYSPMDIAFFSFSNTAVDEGLNRITQRMNYAKNQFRYFRTLHSMAFSLLGLGSEQIISRQLMNQFAKENDLKLAAIDFRTGNVQYQTKDSILLSQLDSAKLLGMSVREYFVKNHIEKPSINTAEKLNAKYIKFKEAHGVIDFTDMILLANNDNIDTPHFKYMFIDEAQDLSTQQWKFVEKLAKNSEKIIIVGDERQAIAEYAGADVKYFLQIPGKLTSLNKSHRIPKKIWELAQNVEKHMLVKRENTMWYPRDREYGETTDGEIVRTKELPMREMARGSWLVLTRTNQQLQDMKQYLMHHCSVMPAFFSVNGTSPVDLDVFKAVTLFEAADLTKGQATKYDFIVPAKTDTPEVLQQKAQFVITLKKFMTSSQPRTAELDKTFIQKFNYRSWFQAFDKLSIPEKQYIQAMRKAYQRTPDGFRKARVKLSTIHSAKGMEADNVILSTAMTATTYKEWQQYKETDDAEVKVLFVGVTRARKKLYLLDDALDGNKYSYNELLG